MTPQDFLPEWVIQGLLAAGVMLSGLFGGLRLFRAGARRNKPDRETAESSLHSRIDALDSKHTELHGETHAAIGQLQNDVSYLKGASGRN